MVVLTREGGGDTGSGVDKVLAFFRTQILDGRLKPGDRLLSERELAAQLDVSRPILREALRSLAMLGVLEIQHGRGTIVRRADVTVLRDIFTFSLAQQPNVLEDVMQARIAIECQAIRLACAHATESDLAAVGSVLEAILATRNDPVAGGEADYRFHLAIVHASHSNVLCTMYDVIADLLRRLHVERRRITTPVAGITEQLVDAHREVFLSLLRRDPDEAERKLREHFTIGDELRRRGLLAAYGDPDRSVPSPTRNQGDNAP